MNASGPNERDLHATLRRRERLVAPFEDDTELAPSPELDRLVLDRARRALREERNGDPQVFRGNTWALPVGIAATILLSFTLVLQLSRPSAESSLAKSSSEADVAQPAIPAAPPRASDTPASTASMIDDTATETGAVRNETVRRRAAPAAAYAPAPPADSAAQATGPVVADRAADRVADGIAETAAPNVAAELAAPNIAAAGAATASVATASAPKEARQEAAMERAVSGRVMKTDVARERDSAPDTKATEFLRSDPRRWLAEIDRLRSVGEAAAADRELAALKRRYPDFPVEAAAPP